MRSEKEIRKMLEKARHKAMYGDLEGSTMDRIIWGAIKRTLEWVLKEREEL